VTRQGALDRYAQYYIQFLPPLRDGLVVRITGKYQPVRYMR
jgi:hypothetical protein